MPIKHFLSLLDLSPPDLHAIIQRAIELKAEHQRGQHSHWLRGKTAVLVFEKPSTRTRVSMEAGIGQFGGQSIFLGPAESHLGRGESIADTARILSRLADVIVMRTGPHQRLEKMAEHASVPVINALSDFNHPCQLLADIQAYTEHRGALRGKKVAWVGDGNNVCHSWMNAARQLDFKLHIATPPTHQPHPTMRADCTAQIRLTDDPVAAVRDCDLVVTDTWSGMGYEKEKSAREQIFHRYRVDEKLMALAAPDALFMHCLPAYRGHEVTAAVIDGPQSIVWDEAENRLHAQKALLEWILPKP